MLEEFLEANRAELIRRCRAKAGRRAHGAAPIESEHGVPQFLAQLIETFRSERTPEALARHKASGEGKPSLALVPSDIQSTAARHGLEMRREGLTIDQVVHGYGDLCQALTELAIEKDAPITVDEFHTFNRCLDDAIADAVTSYTGDWDPVLPPPKVGARSSSGAKQMDRLIESALQSFAAIQSGTVGTRGTTATLHETSLLAMRDLIRHGTQGDEDAGTRVR